MTSPQIDIVALINNGINFALYCTMSAQFRQTFARLIWPWQSSPVRGAPRHRRRRGHTAGVTDELGGGMTDDDRDASATGRPVSDVCGGEASWRITTPFSESELPAEQLEINVLNHY